MEIGNETSGNGGSAGSPNGVAGSHCNKKWAIFPGATGHALSFSSSQGNYGDGGGVDNRSSAAAYIGGCTGGSGGYNSGYVNVTQNSTYTITVGAGGNNAQDKGKVYAYSGNSGFVLIASGGDR